MQKLPEAPDRKSNDTYANKEPSLLQERSQFFFSSD